MPLGFRFRTDYLAVKVSSEERVSEGTIHKHNQLTYREESGEVGVFHLSEGVELVKLLLQLLFLLLHVV